MGHGERYSLEGNYLHNKREEKQMGLLQFENDWLLQGEIIDHTQRGKSPKYVLGMRFGEDGALGLLKLPKNLSLSPVLWYLRPRESVSADNLTGYYDGIWGFAMGMPMIMLQAAAAAQGSPHLEDMTKLGPTEFEMGIFSRGMLDEMEERARRAEQVGQVHLMLKPFG